MIDGNERECALEWTERLLALQWTNKRRVTVTVSGVARVSASRRTIQLSPAATRRSPCTRSTVYSICALMLLRSERMGSKAAAKPTDDQN